MTSWYKFSVDQGGQTGSDAPGRQDGEREAAVLRQPLSPKGTWVSSPQDDNLVSAPQDDNLASSGPSYHTQVCKNEARAMSRVTDIKVGEHTTAPRFISPTLLAPPSFRWCWVVWTLIADEGYFLSLESKNSQEGSLPEQAVIHPAPRGGTGRYLTRDPRLCAVPCPHPRCRQGGELGFSY